MPALIVQSGSEAGRRLEVEGEHTIGREDQEFTLTDPEVSRRHALVRATAAGVEIEDLGSSNGTFVNEDRIAGTTELNDGDTVRIGQTTLTVEAPRTQATRISAAPAPDPGATVIRSSAEVAAPAGAGSADAPIEAAPEPSDYVAPQPESERPTPDGPPEEPSPAEPEAPGYEPQSEPETPGYVPPGSDPQSAPAPAAYQAPQPQSPAPPSAQPDFVTEGGQQPGPPQSGGGGFGGGEQQGGFGGTDQQPAYGGQQGPPAGAQGQGGYAPPGQGGWESGPQQAYRGPGSYAPPKKSNMWLWIIIAVVVVIAIAAALFLFVL